MFSGQRIYSHPKLIALITFFSLGAGYGGSELFVNEWIEASFNTILLNPAR
jgi:hypothetical protein